MNSLRIRLSIAASLTAIAVLAISGWLVFVSVERAMWRQFDADLAADAEMLAGLVEYNPRDGVEFELAPVIERFEDRSEAQSWVAILDASGDVLAGHEFPESMLAVPSLKTVEFEGAHVRSQRLRFEPRTDADVPLDENLPQLTLVIVRETRRIDQFVITLGRAFVVLGVFASLATALAITWQVRRELQPLRAAAQVVEEIDVNALTVRLRDEEFAEELRPFIRQVNAMLGRVQNGLRRERDFSAHVAHELRSPLAVIRAGVEIELQKAERDARGRGRLKSVLRSVDQMTSMVVDLLLLARVESGAHIEVDQQVELDILVDELWEEQLSAALARKLSFTNGVERGTQIAAPLGALRVILRNLLSNAATYTEPGGQVRVTANGVHRIEVWDSGPKLTPDEMARMFDRFWRSDPARSNPNVHAGIGLSLARALAQAHHWALSAEYAEEGGLRFVLARAESRKVASAAATDA